jgi:hypothetical protein
MEVEMEMEMEMEVEMKRRERLLRGLGWVAVLSRHAAEPKQAYCLSRFGGRLGCVDRPQAESLFVPALAACDVIRLPRCRRRIISLTIVGDIFIIACSRFLRADEMFMGMKHLQGDYGTSGS